MILRVKDERSSAICAGIENYAEEMGGLEFPFSFGNMFYGQETLELGLSIPFSDPDHYTHVFHSNCRCRIVPISEESNLMYPGKKLDDVDKLMLTEGAIAENAAMKLATSGDVPDEVVEKYMNNRFGLKLRNFMQFFKKGIEVVYDFVTNKVRSWL